MTVTGLAARLGGKASGLAVAVGIGAAIASAAPAWADPDGTPASSSGAGTAETRSEAVRASLAAKRTPTESKAVKISPLSSKTIDRARAKNSTTQLPAIAATLPNAAPTSASAQSEVAPDRQLAMGKSAISVSAVNAAAPQANPIHDLLATIFPWFDPRGQRITVFKGWQWSFPPQYAFFVNKVSGHATFTADSAYDVQGVDQYDWLKLTGITFTPWRPDTDAIMVAWRYNLDTEMFEIGPYYNSDLARIMPSPDQIISVPADEEFDFSLDYNGITLTYGDRVVFKGLPESLHPNMWTAVRINGWFGGTSPAPRTISYYLHLNCF